MLTLQTEIFLREDGIYRLVVWEVDDEGAKSIRDIVEGDLAQVVKEQLAALDPEGRLRIRSWVRRG